MRKKILVKIKSLKPAHYLAIFAVLVIYAGVVIGIINYRANRTVEPPQLSISSPVEGDTYNTDSVLVQGNTNPRAKVYVNDAEAKADKDGKYSISMPLNVGQNSYKVKTTKNKMTTERIVTVSRVIPAPVVEKKPQSAPVVVGELNNSGPETLWLFEAGSLAAAGAAWQTSKRRLKKSQLA